MFACRCDFLVGWPLGVLYEEETAGPKVRERTSQRPTDWSQG